MSRNARILIVEDVAADGELVERELCKAGMGFSLKRVETREAFLKALSAFKPDVILSDYNLPQFNGLEALRLLKENEISAPFILVTGSLTEEVAVECMKEGAHDYILKTNLTRLPSAVLNALNKKESERAKDEAVEALRRSEERTRGIIDSALDAVVTMDAEGRITGWNPQAETTFGWSREEVVGKILSDTLIPSQYREAHWRGLKHFQASGRGPVLNKRIEITALRRDGHEFPVELTISPARLGNETVFSAFVRDITERKQSEKALRDSEEQLRQSQKLEAVGQLAGGVAHDFNNILTVILGYSDLLMRRISEGDPIRAKLEEIKRAAERAATLTRQLLAFSRKQFLQPEIFDLNTLVVEMNKMLGRLIGEDIELTSTLAGDLARVCADPGQIEQVLMNLVVNARDALPDGGKIRIETANVEIDQTYAGTHLAVQPGSYVMLAVSDDGCGFDAETQKHIFEPFFTTKEQGRGTGLGLSTVYGIVKQSGGNIWVYSEPGQGTAFKIYLPRAGGQSTRPGSDSENTTIPGGTETLLLVEDESQIRQMAFELLSASGYSVLESSNGLEALGLLEQHKEPVHLILTDVVMPKMSGRELAERAAAIKPETKVLYMSGYTNDAIVHHGVIDSGTWFIQKPFAPEALARKVREVLDSDERSESEIVVSKQGGNSLESRNTFAL